MENNLSENGRNLTAGVDLWNFGIDSTRNYSEINEAFAMPQVSQRSSLLYQINVIRSLLIKSALRGTGTSRYKWG